MRQVHCISCSFFFPVPPLYIHLAVIDKNTNKKQKCLKIMLNGMFMQPTMP